MYEDWELQIWKSPNYIGLCGIQGSYPGLGGAPRTCLLPALPSGLCHPQVTGSPHPSLLTHNQGRAFKTDSMGPSCLEKQTQALVRLCPLGRLNEWLEGSRQLFTSCLLNHYFGAL